MEARGEMSGGGHAEGAAGGSTRLVDHDRLAIIEHAQDIAGLSSYAIDLRTRRIIWRGHLARRFGASEQELDEDLDIFWSVVHPEDREAVRVSTREQIAAGAARLSAAYRAVTTDGDVVWLETRGTIERDPDGTPIRVVGAAQDVTAYRAAIDSLRATAHELLVAQQLGRVGTWAWYPATGRTDYSDEALRIMGYEPGTSGDSLLDSILHPDDREAFAVASRNAFESSERLDAEFRVDSPTGDERWLRLQGETDRDAKGKPLRVVGVLLDVTERHREEEERRRLEDTLRQSRRLDALGQLAGGIAHDFNNLLTVISGSAEIALDRGSRDAYRDALVEITRAAERASALTQQLLVFGGRHEVTAQPVDLNGCVVGTLRLLRRLIEANVEIVDELSNEPPIVVADPSQCEQVLTNLALNARDAMPSGGVLTIRTRLDAAEGMGVLEVEDTGVGIAPAIAGHVFEPFFTTKPPDKGTGLGLATVYGIVQSFGGTIDVASTEGVGTTFTIAFPLASTAPS